MRRTTLVPLALLAAIALVEAAQPTGGPDDPVPVTAEPLHEVQHRGPHFLIYTNWIFQAVLYFFVIFHVLNGLRIIFLDFWPQFLKYQREATWVQWAILIPLYGMVLFFMFTGALAGS